MNPIPLKTVYVILLLFVLAAFIRFPQANRPLSYHHEFCTAVALRVMDIWWENGIANYHFSPVMTYPGEANKQINNHATGSMQMIDTDKNYYYISHPPFAYYLPYAVFSLLHTPPSVFGLQFFQWFVHLLCGVMLFLIAKYLASYLDTEHRKLFPLAVFTAYLFNPSTLWFQGNVYMSDTLVQLFVIAGMCLWWLQFYTKHALSKRTALSLMFVVSFLGGFTSWYAFIFSGALLLIAFFSKKEKQSALLLAFSAIAGVLFSLLVTVLIYSQINGVEAVFAELTQRFGQRGFTAWNFSRFFSYFKMLGFNYAANYQPYLLFIIAAVVYLLIKTPGQFSKKYLAVFLPVFLPLVLLHLFLPNYVGHDFTTLYAAPFVAIFSAYLWTRLINSLPSMQHATVIALIVVFTGVFLYNLINRPGEYSIKGKPYDVYMKNGNYIQNQIPDEQVVFLKNRVAKPQLVYYAKRNIRTVESKEQAKQLLAEQWPGLAGVLIYMDEEGRIFDDEKFEF